MISFRVKFVPLCIEYNVRRMENIVELFLEFERAEGEENCRMWWSDILNWISGKGNPDINPDIIIDIIIDIFAIDLVNHICIPFSSRANMNSELIKVIFFHIIIIPNHHTRMNIVFSFFNQMDMLRLEEI